MNKMQTQVREFHFTDEQAKTLNDMAILCHANAVNHGWWEAPRNDGELIALMHSELSEALEALRHGNPPDDHCPALSGVAAEMADTVIRIFDMCEARKIDIGKAVQIKHAYNCNRPFKHGGKKF